MIIKTRIFDLCNGHYRNLTELARAMEISVSQVYRVREGKRNINQSFIIGAIKAFPEYRLDDLFYFTPQESSKTGNFRYQSLIDEEVAAEARSEKSAEQALGEITLAAHAYAQHIKSHTSAIIGLSETSQEIKNTVAELNRILNTLNLKNEKNESK